MASLPVYGESRDDDELKGNVGYLGLLLAFGRLDDRMRMRSQIKNSQGDETLRNVFSLF